MNTYETTVWEALQKDIIDTCKVVVLEQYMPYVEKNIQTEVEGDYKAGYSEENGYYYISEDGEEFYTKSAEDMKLYIIRDSFYEIGSAIELENRKENRKDWLYYKDETTPADDFKKNPSCKYHTQYDPRKYVYDYTISKLYACFDKALVEVTEKEYTDYLNLWFDDAHWKYVHNEFAEQSDSQDKRMKK